MTTRRAPSAIRTTPVTDRPWRYTRTAIALHWVISVFLVLLASVGWYMLSVEDQPGTAWLFDTHKSFGIVAFVLIATRLAWRLAHRPAPLPADVKPWEAQLARLSQALLYLLMFAMPITGFTGSIYSKYGVRLFGWQMPAWVAPDHDVSEQFFNIHGVLIWVLIGVAALHVVGALKHLLFNRDGVFQRMW